MAWSTKEAIDYCVAHMRWEMVHPTGVTRTRDIPEKTKTVVFRVPGAHLEVAIPLNRKDVVSCYVPNASASGIRFPADAPWEIHPGLSVRERYPRDDGRTISNTLLRRADSLHPEKKPYMLGVDSAGALEALLTWIANSRGSSPPQFGLQSKAPRTDDGNEVAPETIPASEQGIELDPAVRNAVELHAEGVAKAHYLGLGYSVLKFGKPFDLLCEKDGHAIHVEVKGSTNSLSAVTLTVNEVSDARSRAWESALFVVDQILVAGGPGVDVMCRGGRARIIERWMPSEEALEPTEFRYRLPDMRSL